jgi:hypothetical protein
LESHHYPQVSQALLHRTSLTAIRQSPIVREHTGHFRGERAKVVYALRSFRNRCVCYSVTALNFLREDAHRAG